MLQLLAILFQEKIKRIKHALNKDGWCSIDDEHLRRNLITACLSSQTGKCISLQAKRIGCQLRNTRKVEKLLKSSSMWKKISAYFGVADMHVLYLQDIQVPDGYVPAQGVHRDHNEGPQMAVTIAFAETPLKTEFWSRSHIDTEAEELLHSTTFKGTKSRPCPAASIDKLLTRSDSKFIVYDMHIYHRASERAPEESAESGRFFLALVPSSQETSIRREIKRCNV